MATNDAINLNQLKQSVFNMKNYVDKSLPDSDKYINERITEKDIDTTNPEYETVSSNGSKQYLYNFDITNMHSNIMAVICELSINNTTTNYITSVREIENYETNSSTISLPIIRIYDDTTNLEIGKCYVGIRGTRIVDSEGNIVATKGQYDSAYIQFARSTEHITNDTNNLYSKGFKLKVKFYDISDKYAGNVYHIPYNLKNGKGSSLCQETCQISDNATNSLVMGYKSVCNSSNSINVGYDCTSNGTGVMVAASSTINSNASYLFGTGSTINRMYSMSIGMGLNIPAASSNKGSMIIGTGGTLATDSSFAISTAKIKTSSTNCDDIRYPFEVKTNDDVYLRGKNVFLETDNEPTEDNHLISKKYVDNKVAGIVNSAPEALDTLNELAQALGNNPNFATTVATQIGNKVDKEDGKSLTTNDLTNDLKANYDAAYAYSQATHSYNDLTDKPEIPSIEGLATKEYVNVHNLIREFPLRDPNSSAVYLNDITESGLYMLPKKPDGTRFTSFGLKLEETTTNTVVKTWAGSGYASTPCRITIRTNGNNFINIDNIVIEYKAAATQEECVWNRNPYFLTNTNSIVFNPTYDYNPATKKYVDDVKASIVIPTKTSELTNDSNYLTSIPDEYITETELSAKGYLTEHQSLDGYAKTSDIPSVEGLATEEYVTKAIAAVSGSSDVATDDEVKSAINDILGGDYVE